MRARHAARRASYASYGSGGSYGSWGRSYGSVGASYGSGGYASGGGSYGSTYSAVSYAAPATYAAAPVYSAPAYGVSVSEPVYESAPVYDSFSSDSCVTDYGTGSAFTDYGVVNEGYIEGGIVDEGYIEGSPIDQGYSTEPPIIDEGEMAPADANENGADQPIPEARLRQGGLLVLNLPADAQVYVNGYKTTSTGTQRRMMSSGLKSGRQYNYEVRAVVGDRAITKFATLTAGQTIELGFDFDAPVSEDTVMTVYVPDDATVNLAGSDMKQTGRRRVFATKRLAAGKSWDDYLVRVSIERNGRTLTQERKLDVRSGESYELTFDFEDNLVAAR